MKIKQLISELQEVEEEHGNLDTGVHGLTGRITKVKVTEKGVTYCYFE